MSLRRWVLGAGIAALSVGCGVGNDPNWALPAQGDVAQVSAAFAEGQAIVGMDVYGASHDQLTQLGRLGMDVWGHDRQRVRGTFPRAAWELIRAWGLRVGKLRNSNPFSNSYDPEYLTTTQMASELQALATRYPNLCRLVTLGKSYEGRPILSLEIGTGNRASKPGVLFTGENHARELVTPQIPLQIAHWMLDGYGNDPAATFAVDNRDTWITPMVNPDGHVRAEQGMDWRKNADPSNGGDPSSFGVDLNRNYDDRNWGSTGTDTDPNGETYGGPGPFSEPETRTMSNLYKSRKFTFLMTWHSYSNSVMWPWNDNDEAPADKRMPAIGVKLGQLSGYQAYQGDQLYDTSGDDTDYCYGKLGIMSYTVEVGSMDDGFDPPFSRMDQFYKENLPMAQYLEKIADNPGAVFGPEIGQRGALRVSSTRIPTGAGRELIVERAQGPGGVWGAPMVTWAD